MKKISIQYKIWLTGCLFLAASVAAIYVTSMMDHHIWTFLGMYNDGRFHVMRMEGLYRSIQHGSNFPIVNMSFLGGFGYISNVFYSNLWLYPVAWLRLLGLSMAHAFVLFCIMLNFLTFVISFSCFYHASRRYDKSLLFSFIYTLSTYRIFDLVRRFDIGEVLTLTFLPIVVLGVYEIFYHDSKQWLFLTVGMVNVIYSHALSPILIMIFIFCVILFRVKALIKEPKRILSLIYAGVTTLLLTLSYFVPIMEQLQHTQFKLTSPLVNISQTSLAPQELIDWSIHDNLYTQNVGPIILLIACLIPIIIWYVHVPVIRDFAIIGDLFMIMTTNIFPWKAFEKTPLKIIQFPWRFDMLVTILLAILLAADPLAWFEQSWKKVVVVALSMGLVIGSEVRLIQQHPAEYNTYTDFDHLDSNSIGSGQEYLPKETNLETLIKQPHRPQVLKGKVKINDFQQEQSRITFRFDEAKNAAVSVPVIAYYGYSDRNSVGNVSKLTMDSKNNGLGLVKLQGDGIVHIDYYGTPLRRVARLISLISALVLVIFVLGIWKKE